MRMVEPTLHSVLMKAKPQQTYEQEADAGFNVRPMIMIRKPVNLIELQR